ncbi:MAG: hypothetical protein JWO02_587, partial [Solirubrobacterales bacterium]|nr:hypothetical protein [Solirubrobacterales bacterium]
MATAKPGRETQPGARAARRRARVRGTLVATARALIA